MATDVYLSLVNNCPCGDTVIHLYKGADSSQEERNHLLQFLKGNKQQKSALKKHHPQLYEKFERVWQVRQAHMIKHLPAQYYVFFIVCCLRPDCAHPICKSQTVQELPLWYDGGHSITIYHYLSQMKIVPGVHLIAINAKVSAMGIT